VKIVIVLAHEVGIICGHVGQMATTVNGLFGYTFETVCELLRNYSVAVCFVANEVKY